jgi:NAD(P)-dependent dehydrogenase (short-subunit alcohol dehydrogenase family)
MGKYLIFGATGSIGSKLSENMYESDKEVHLIGRDEEELKKLASKLNSEYSVIDILSNNLSETIKENFGDKNISGIAYCIGSIDLKPLRVTKKEDFKKCLDVNFFPVIEIIKSLQDNLKKNNGSIILFSTVAVKKGFTNHAIISSAKGAIEGLTVSLAAEFAPNIRVNCIAPSLTDSKMSQSILKNKMMADGIAKSHPMKRIGQAADIASMAKFLLSDESPWITGQIIGVDGGKSSLS